MQLKYFLVLVVFGGLQAHAQKFNVGGGLGVLNYRGDLAPTFDYRQVKPGGSLFFRYNLSKAISLRAGFMLGRVGADDSRSSDPFNQARNLSFRSTITEGSAIAEYNFLNYKNRKKQINWTPYVFGGLGYYRFKPTVRTGEYGLNQLAVPYGVGIKWEIKRPWSLEFEYGTRRLFTDNLDNLGSNIPANAPKIQQGFPEQRDQYYYFSVSLSYTFYTIFCPEE
jgi:Domain of unknown function (DUF6089)